MPIINSISTADNTTLNTFSVTGFSNQLVYFIVQLVIQTEYASNGNKPLTQKQITEWICLQRRVQSNRWRNKIEGGLIFYLHTVSSESNANHLEITMRFRTLSVRWHTRKPRICCP